MSDQDPKKIDVPQTATGFRFLDRALNVIGAVAAILATVWGVFIKIQVDSQNLKVDELKTAISQAESNREDRKLNQQLTLQVFDQVNDIYKTPNQSADIVINRLSAVSALILIIPDQTVKDSLKRAVDSALNLQIAKGGDQAKQAQIVKSNFDAASFDASTASETVEAVSNSAIKVIADQSNSNSPKWGALNYNLFWCEDTTHPDAALEAANHALALKKLDKQASGDWRVRKLPKSVNERSGYQIHTNIIRTSSSDETKVGKVLASVLANYGSPGFEVKEVSYPSPASISIFFCGNGKPN